MGMSNYIMDCEEQFEEKIADFVAECEHFTEAYDYAIEIGKRMVPFMDQEEIIDRVGDLWNEYWANYA